MNIHYKSFESLEPTDQEIVASLVSQYSQEHVGIVTVQPTDIYAKHSGFVGLSGDTFVGYVGAAKPQFHNNTMLTKIGSLVVAPSHQKNGVATKLITAITEHSLSKNLTPYAFCNEDSRSRFERCGYIAPQPGQLPVWVRSELGNEPLIVNASRLPRVMWL